MNCSIILLFLLLFNQNGRMGCGDMECGCEQNPPGRPRERERECERGRERERERECGRERDMERDGCPCNGESRFEPRFDSRPFSDTGCGCSDK